MSVLQTAELQQKVPTLTIAFVVVMLIIGFGAGYTVSELKSQSRVLELQHSFALDEVHGLRSDMEREVLLLREKIKELEAKIK